jgi:diguanylate cyclase (GGDEF)-like protein/PAS domain S-box-containing protein
MSGHRKREGVDFRPPGESSESLSDSELELRRLMQELSDDRFDLLEKNRDLRDALQATESSRDRYARLYDQAPIGYCTLDGAGVIREINLTGASMLGAERNRLVGSPLQQHLDPGQDRALQDHIQAVRSSARRLSLDVTLTPPHATLVIHLRLESAPGKDDAGDWTCLTVLQDVTEQQRLIEHLREREQDLSHRALHDPLTGLPNRSLFADRLEQAIAHARRSSRALGVLFIDLDRFKLVNDTLGHAFGDEILKTVAHRLREQVRQVDTVARIGGDEFLMLVSPIGTSDAAGVVAQKLIEALRRPYPGPRGEVYLTVSIGIGIYPDDGRTGDDLLRNADHAMYTAKQQGRNAFRFFTPEMTDIALDRLRLQASLSQAMERGELVLHYQPQLAPGSHRIPGIEALVRWVHPLLGLLPPGRFLALAEETGLIREIDAWVLRAACNQRKQWQKQGLDDGTVIQVNVSNSSFERPQFAEEVECLLRELDLSPRLLTLELAETAQLCGSPAALKNANTLKGLGVELSVDHFGVAPSPLGDLKRLEIAELKIDMSFIQGIPDDDGAAITLATLVLGDALGLRVVAQGVETQGQADFLRRAGCSTMQGYFYTQPLGPDDLMRFVKTWG